MIQELGRWHDGCHRTQEILGGANTKDPTVLNLHDNMLESPTLMVKDLDQEDDNVTNLRGMKNRRANNSVAYVPNGVPHRDFFYCGSM